ncbi:hypothetical protein BDW22DRAFT_1401282 [Trametopsis cervina]|nr:hypothetical protein BDW22DRAFT_1401282 [Trametopsis cervina]
MELTSEPQESVSFLSVLYRPLIPTWVCYSSPPSPAPTPTATATETRPPTLRRTSTHFRDRAELRVLLDLYQDQAREGATMEAEVVVEKQPGSALEEEGDFGEEVVWWKKMALGEVRDGESKEEDDGEKSKPVGMAREMATAVNAEAGEGSEMMGSGGRSWVSGGPSGHPVKFD